ncbi:MAG TPA: hypothetical protein DIW54_00760 [Chitinophagaceae bacterium]|nr:hypothetical protein [Chitinophagaceae bacterium]HCT21933.1 hypothetical protein [Chitinophagaceae bacterium]
MKYSKAKFLHTLNLSLLVFYILFPVVIILLPENYFDSGESICLSKLLFDFECYACGLTRGCKHLLHLNFEKAYEYNMLSFVALPAISLVWLKSAYEQFKKVKKSATK